MIEKIIKPVQGVTTVLLSIILLVLAIVLFFTGISSGPELTIAGVICFFVFVFLLKGLLVIQPNCAKVVSFFGRYKGTVKSNGLYFINPFYHSQSISLRAQNLQSDTLKVNDKMGNPVEIAAVIVWKVGDTAKALYDVDNYGKFVYVQIDAAIRHLAMSFPYDSMEDEEAEITLRDGGDKINHILEQELTERLQAAGITIDEARISHLAYAPEIAGAMLQRQQAAAIVAARTKIVEGAVGMVDMAVKKLEQENIVVMDNDRKAAMVSNLMVVLCGEKSAQPVVTTNN